MKVVVGLVVLAVLIGGIVYYAGGVASFDPSQQGRDARAAIKPGMTWKKVVDVAGAPSKYRVIQEKVKRWAGEETVTYEPGAFNPFNADRLGARIAEDSVPHGFLFNYQFSDTVAFTVHFDGTGTVMGIQDAGTLADLLQMDPD
jgi:hypothetical protein